MKRRASGGMAFGCICITIAKLFFHTGDTEGDRVGGREGVAWGVGETEGDRVGGREGVAWGVGEMKGRETERGVGGGGDE